MLYSTTKIAALSALTALTATSNTVTATLAGSRSNPYQGAASEEMMEDGERRLDAWTDPEEWEEYFMTRMLEMSANGTNGTNVTTPVTVSSTTTVGPVTVAASKDVEVTMTFGMQMAIEIDTDMTEAEFLGGLVREAPAGGSFPTPVVADSTTTTSSSSSEDAVTSEDTTTVTTAATTEETTAVTTAAAETTDATTTAAAETTEATTTAAAETTESSTTTEAASARRMTEESVTTAAAETTESSTTAAAETTESSTTAAAETTESSTTAAAETTESSTTAAASSSTESTTAAPSVAVSLRTALESGFAATLADAVTLSGETMNAAATDAIADVALTSAEFVAASSRKLQIKARRLTTLGANKNLSVEFTVAGLSKNQAAVVEHSVAANAASLTGNFEGYVQTSIDNNSVLSSSVSNLAVSDTIAVATADYVAPTTPAPVVADSTEETTTETTTAAPEEEEEETTAMSAQMMLIVAILVVAVIMGAAGMACGWCLKGFCAGNKTSSADTRKVDIADEEEKVDLAEAGEKNEVKA